MTGAPNLEGPKGERRTRGGEMGGKRNHTPALEGNWAFCGFCGFLGEEGGGTTKGEGRVLNSRGYVQGEGRETDQVPNGDRQGGLWPRKF